MVSIKWCCKQKDGIRIVEPNENLAHSYIKMAEDAIGTMSRERSYNLVFSISAAYYSMYYSLYSVLMKIGIKCEIHSCTLELMRTLLSDIYSGEDFMAIKRAFDLRGIAQYYADRIIKTDEIDFVMKSVPIFLSKSKGILSRINEKDISALRKRIEEMKK